MCPSCLHLSTLLYTLIIVSGQLFYIGDSIPPDNANGSEIFCIIYIFKDLIKGSYKIKYPSDPSWEADAGGAIKGRYDALTKRICLSTYRDGDRKTIMEGNFYFEFCSVLICFTLNRILYLKYNYSHLSLCNFYLHLIY